MNEEEKKHNWGIKRVGKKGEKIIFKNTTTYREWRNKNSCDSRRG